MSGRLIETAVRPVRIAFLLCGNPSSRLINSVISVNSGLWGGIYNSICPTDGNSLAAEYLELLKYHSPDLVALCGKFTDAQNVIDQLEHHNIRPCFLYRRISLDAVGRVGIGIEGIFDSRFVQNLRRGAFRSTAVVNTLAASATLLDKVMFGIPPKPLKKRIEGRADLVTPALFRKESRREKPTWDEMTGIIQMSGENLRYCGATGGRRMTLPAYRFVGLLFVAGDDNSLEDTCYFWNLRAVLGEDMVKWVPLNELPAFLRRPQVAHFRRLTLTAAPGASSIEAGSAVEKSRAAGGRARYVEAKAILRIAPNSVWRSELKREHIATSDGGFVLPVSRPPSFEPGRFRRWVMDLRVVRDDTIGTEGFVSPNLPSLPDMVTPGRGTQLRPRMHGQFLSLQVTSGRADELVALRIPPDWEVIRAIFEQSGYRICLSDQGNYMSRALALFGGLARLSSLLRDQRIGAILDEFVRHHRTREQIGEGNRYRRALTLDEMTEVVLRVTGSKGRKKREKASGFVEDFLREHMRLGAVHSGYILDCSKCRFEEWYPIDEVAEDYRCRRCLSKEIRPPSPPVRFRLNEALYQAYLHNFTVPALVLDILHESSGASFIFSPQIRLDEGDEHSREVDIVALCDGGLTIGEAKSTDKIKKEQIDCLESTALAVKARRIVLCTTSHHSCSDMECAECSKKEHYADNAFSHGSDKGSQSWGTRERIRELRESLRGRDVEVTSICPQDVVLRTISRNRIRPTRVSAW